MSAFADFLAIDRALTAHGFPPCSEWWRTEVARFYAHPTARTWAARVGRGGSKSTTLAKLALCEVLTGAFRVPPGERHYGVFISTNRDEAAQRLRQLEAFLDALDVAYSRAGDTIDLRDSPRGFKVLACTVAAASGFRCLVVTGDEVAKWRSADDAANPAKEVAASARAMTVTHSNARMLFFSSPLASTDWHSTLIAAGDGDGQVTSVAPTWTATDGRISEAQCRTLEPDPRLFAREYGAEPQAAQLAAFEEADVDAAFAPRGDLARQHRRALVIDASSGKKDRWTWAVCGWRASERGPVLTVDDLGGFDSAQVRELGSESIVELLCAKASGLGASTVFADQREAMALGAAFRRGGLRFVELPWTASSKPRAVARVRRWLFERRVALPSHDAMRRELLSFEERITPSGEFTFGARGSGHDDFVALLITAALADEGRMLDGSPLASASLGAHVGGAPLAMRQQNTPHVADRYDPRSGRILSRSDWARRPRARGGF